MASQESIRKPSNGPLWVMCIFVALGLAAFIWTIRADLPKTLPTIVVQTAGPAVQPTRAPIAPVTNSGGYVAAPRVIATPIPGLAGNEATAEAMYRQAIEAAEPAVINEGVPVELIQRTFDRQPAGENVPTAEPQADTSHGSKDVGGPVNIQETHQCRHGQIWIDGKGCKNP